MEEDCSEPLHGETTWGAANGDALLGPEPCRGPASMARWPLGEAYVMTM